MELKKYLLIDVVPNPNYMSHDNADPNHEPNTILFKPKVITGFFRSEIDAILNVQEIWNPLGNNQDNLFFFPGCSVPRFKVREHFSCTIKLDKATAAFVSKNTLTGSDNTFKHYRSVKPIPKHELFAFLHDVHQPFIYDTVDSILQNPNIDGVYLSRELWKEHAYNNTVGVGYLAKYTKTAGYRFKYEI